MNEGCSLSISKDCGKGVISTGCAGAPFDLKRDRSRPPPQRLPPTLDRVLLEQNLGRKRWPEVGVARLRPRRNQP